MEIGFTAEQQALRQELRQYYGSLLTPEVQEALAESDKRTCGKILPESPVPRFPATATQPT